MQLKDSWKRKTQHSRHTEVLKTRSHAICFLILCVILPVRFGLVDESLHKLSFQNVNNSCVGKSAQTCWNVSLQSYYYKVCIHNYVMVMLDGHVLTLNVQIHMLWWFCGYSIFASVCQVISKNNKPHRSKRKNNITSDFDIKTDLFNTWCIGRKLQEDSRANVTPKRGIGLYWNK